MSRSKKIEICIRGKVSIFEKDSFAMIAIDEESIIDALVEHAKDELEFVEDGWGDEWKSRLWDKVNRRWNFMLIEFARSIANGRFKKVKEKNNEDK